MHKYIHILWHNELKFTSRVVEMIDSDTAFDKGEHLFVTPYPDVYNALKKYGNVEFYKTDQPRDIDIVNEYAPKCQYLILHNICETSCLLRLKKKYRKKIFWRSWGGDRPEGFSYVPGRPIRNCIKWFINTYYTGRIVRQFAGIGIANTVDKIELSKKFGNVKTFPMPYVTSTIEKKRLQVERGDGKSNDGVFKIAVGHSGFRDDKHLQVLEVLKHFEHEKIKLYFPLSYGDQEYITELKQYIASHWDGEYEIIEEFMEYEDYMSFLNQMDMGIIAGTYSYALGNISALLAYQKTIVLSNDGVIAEAFQYEQIPYMPLEKVGQMSLEKFIQPMDYSSGTWKALSSKTYEEYVNQWRDILNYLR